MSGRDTGYFAVTFILCAVLVGALIGLFADRKRTTVRPASADTLEARRLQAEARRIAAGGRAS